MVAIGEKFGKLTVEKQIGKRGVYFLWLCKCDCGNDITVSADYLKRSECPSCGCEATKNKTVRKET